MPIGTVAIVVKAMEGLMSHIVKMGADRLPTILGGGILGIVAVGLPLGLAGVSLTLIGQGLSAAAGMVVASRYA
jgi:hypothetical protein